MITTYLAYLQKREWAGGKHFLSSSSSSSHPPQQRYSHFGYQGNFCPLYLFDTFWFCLVHFISFCFNSSLTYHLHLLFYHILHSHIFLCLVFSVPFYPNEGGLNNCFLIMGMTHRSCLQFSPFRVVESISAKTGIAVAQVSHHIHLQIIAFLLKFFAGGITFMFYAMGRV